MPNARKETVLEGEEGVYHCVARCVRRAFLCGVDRYSGRDYEHRKDWVRERLEFLAGCFGVEVVTYSVMANHFHVIVRTRPDGVADWTDDEVARRWLRLFPRGPKRARTAKGIALEAQVEVLKRSVKRMAELRKRLSSVSWFMRCLNEYIARRANAEDGCKGRFWEGRFKCQALLDEAAILACMAYVDLNPVRAGLAETPEESEHTGVYERIEARQAKARIRKLREKRQMGSKSASALTPAQHRQLEAQMQKRNLDRWLCPIEVRKAALAAAAGGRRDHRRDAAATSGRRGVLGMSTDEYLALLDWTGRELKSDKRGAIPLHLAPLLKRLALDAEAWVETVERYGRLFWRVAGSAEALVKLARRTGRRWFRGVRSGQELYRSKAG